MAGTSPNFENPSGVAEFDLSRDGNGINHQLKLDTPDLRDIMAGPYTAENLTEQPHRNYAHESYPSDYGTEHLHRSLVGSSVWEATMSSNVDRQDRRDSWERDEDGNEEERRNNKYSKDEGEDSDAEDDLSFHEIRFGDGQPRMSSEIPQAYDHSSSPRFLGTPLDMGHEQEVADPGSTGRSRDPGPIDLEAQKPRTKLQGRLIPILCVAAWLTIPVISTFGMFGALTSHVKPNHDNGAPA